MPNLTNPNRRLVALALPFVVAGMAGVPHAFAQSLTKGAARLDTLFHELANAKTELEGRAAENKIWLAWMAQPDEPIRDMVERAMSKRREYNFKAALEILDMVIERAPDYAEGWNQRAFVLFLQEKNDASLADLQKALELEPRHFGAMAGQANILMRTGRVKLAQKILKEAVKIHPYLKERGMIVDTGEKDI